MPGAREGGAREGGRGNGYGGCTGTGVHGYGDVWGVEVMLKIERWFVQHRQVGAGAGDGG